MALMIMTTAQPDQTRSFASGPTTSYKRSRGSGERNCIMESKNIRVTKNSSPCGEWLRRSVREGPFLLPHTLLKNSSAWSKVPAGRWTCDSPCDRVPVFGFSLTNQRIFIVRFVRRLRTANLLFFLLPGASVAIKSGPDWGSFKMQTC